MCGQTAAKAAAFQKLWEMRRSAAAAYAAGDAVTFARERLGIEPDEKQAEVLRADMHRALLCCSRQWGKSMVAVILALWHMLNRPGAFVVVVGPTERQAGELVWKVRGFLNRLGMAARRDGLVRHSLVLPNGSRMIALPTSETTTRGYGGATLLLVDEAAHVPDEVYDAMRPFLAVNRGALWLISTPHGKRGFFWRAWELEGARWQRFLVQAKDCPRLPEEFLREERETRGERRYKQEYECEFLEMVGRVLDVNLLLTRVTKDFQPLRV